MLYNFNSTEYMMGTTEQEKITVRASIKISRNFFFPLPPLLLPPLLLFLLREVAYLQNMFQESVLICVPTTDLLWSLASTLVSTVVGSTTVAWVVPLQRLYLLTCTKIPTDVNGLEIHVEASGNINVSVMALRQSIQSQYNAMMLKLELGQAYMLSYMLSLLLLKGHNSANALCILSQSSKKASMTKKTQNGRKKKE